ncbi:MAG: DUF4065 domain-containing protein [Gammaproteobacteria bacterium]|nr:DUF4065 domain-containing protein [Gammaproteobacteria bacterium]MYK43757.1 DUF4065 domain-containing protein [Gammaproteobacteria bacterium]
MTSFDGYPVRWVANCFLQHSFKRSELISPMKLQKLVYYLHGWHLASTGLPVIDSRFSVWRYGPVEPTLYSTFKRFGRSPITVYAKEPDNPREYWVVSKKDSEFQSVFEYVVKNYFSLSAIELSARTHSKHSPWQIAKDTRNYYIDNELIKGYFINLARNPVIE